MSSLIRAVAAFTCVLAFGTAHAQGYPTKPVFLVVPYSAGGGADALARAIAQSLSTLWEQRVVVENRPGANQSIGAEYVAKAAADGYTLMLFETSLVINPSLYSKVPYDPFRDFAPVTGLVTWAQLLVVHPSLPVKNVSDLIELAKSRSGQLSYASQGAGSIPHLTMAMLQSMAGITLNHIPYKGGGPAVTDLAGGHVQMMFGTISVVLSQWKAGKVKMLAVASNRRLAQFPDVPTVGETGLPGFEFNAWFGLVAPAGTPHDVVTRINADVHKIFADPAFREKFLAPQAYEPITSSPGEFADYMRAEARKWGDVVRQAKIKLD
ncbi:MAG TPA: tripartite tricarboxylate transporter substrate binding protein [Burkholderiales bacterium]|jgi:tripartite-type tricarboxylate transporter receptor subunit TctC|nr:tripartite tricarboxylate transporter substrate binding protein [Burkholderiales bacterium]